MSMLVRISAAAVVAILASGIVSAQAPGKGQPASGKTPPPAAKTAPPPAKGAPPAANQSPAQPAPPVSPSTAAPQQQPPTPPANYEYKAETRRDPFLSLVNRGADRSSRDGASKVTRARDGLAALTTDEVSVRGILLSRGRWMAMVTGPGGKMFTAKAGDRLADGVVREVTPTALVILQEVNDPLSLEKQREVVKPLRGGGEGVK